MYMDWHYEGEWVVLLSEGYEILRVVRIILGFVGVDGPLTLALSREGRGDLKHVADIYFSP